MQRTKIEWSDYSWPIINGCRRASPASPAAPRATPPCPRYFQAAAELYREDGELEAAMSDPEKLAAYWHAKGDEPEPARRESLLEKLDEVEREAMQA